MVALLPTTFDYWMGCEIALSVSQLSRPVHNEQLNSSPQECVQHATRLVKWAGQLQRRFGKCVQVHLVDAISLEGFWLTLRHRVRRYPAIIIDGRIQPRGSGDLRTLEGVISRELAVGTPARDAPERR